MDGWWEMVGTTWGGYGAVGVLAGPWRPFGNTRGDRWGDMQLRDQRFSAENHRDGGGRDVGGLGRAWGAWVGVRGCGEWVWMARGESRDGGQ